MPAMEAVKEELYILPRSGSEAQRLERQHIYVLSCQGYYLHPDIPSPSTGTRVADLCTGTAIWLREFATAHPGAELHGFDISDGMFPDPELLPSNVKLHLADVKEPFDSKWHGYFDVVHIRWIQIALGKDDWALVVRNINTLLKPGGWLQWVEDDRSAAMRHACRQVAPLGALQQSLTASDSQVVWKPERFSYLASVTRSIFTHENLERLLYGCMNLNLLMSDPACGNMDRVVCDSFVVDRDDDGGEMRRGWAGLNFSAVLAMLSKEEIFRASGVSPEEWERRSKEEIDRGAQWVARATVFIGQKKLVV